MPAIGRDCSTGVDNKLWTSIRFRWFVRQFSPICLVFSAIGRLSRGIACPEV